MNKIKTCLAVVTAAGILSIVTPVKATNEAPSSFAFDVRAKGFDMGRHSVAVVEQDGVTTVDIVTDLRVRKAFITFFRLNHHSKEVWRDGRLVSLDAETKKNGKTQQVTALAADQNIIVDSGEQEFLVSLDAIPTSFTKNNLFKRQAELEFDLIDSINGLSKRSILRFHERHQLDLDGRIADVDYYTVTNLETGQLSHEFWIDDDGMALKIHMISDDGTSVHYDLVG